MIPVNELARICLGSLMITTFVTFLSYRFKVIELIRQYKVSDFLFTIINVITTYIALNLFHNSFFIGLVALYGSVLLWIIQYNKHHSVWLRPIFMTVLLVLYALLFLQWFDDQTFWAKLRFLYDYL
jgi:hypothetical protein